MASAKISFLRTASKHFPNLNSGNFDLTSPQTASYNCIAWASGDDTRWWWPGSPPYYWPPGIPNSSSVAAFVMMYSNLGYIERSDDSVELGFEKVAIYVDSLGRVTHAARQLASGQWTSKLGKEFDISHTLGAIEGGTYGAVACILKRPVPLATPLAPLPPNPSP